jgi:threonine dehydratase
MSRPTTPLHQQTNGLYSGVQTPKTGVQTPKTPNHQFALTEYSAQPSPPADKNKPKDYGVPEAFLLPSGTPDV